MSRPNLSIVPPSELENSTLPTLPEAPLSPITPLSPASRRKHESTWERIQRLKREAEAYHQRRRASSATEPPVSLTDLQEEVTQTRIKEEEEDKQLEEQEKAEEERKKKEAEEQKIPSESPAKVNGRGEEKGKEGGGGEKEPTTPSAKKGFRPPPLNVSADPTERPKTPVTPKTPSTPRSPFKVSSAEIAEVTDDLKMLWGEMRKQRTELLWVLLGFTDTKSRKVIIRGIGTAKEGIADLKKKLEQKAVQFGALRVTGIDGYGRRPKFVGFALIGAELTPSQKLQAMHAKEIQRDLFTGIHVMEFPSSQDLEINIAKKLLSLEKSVTSFDFGGNLSILASSLGTTTGV